MGNKYTTKNNQVYGKNTQSIVKVQIHTQYSRSPEHQNTHNTVEVEPKNLLKIPNPFICISENCVVIDPLLIRGSSLSSCRFMVSSHRYLIPSNCTKICPFFTWKYLEWIFFSSEMKRFFLMKPNVGYTVYIAASEECGKGKKNNDSNGDDKEKRLRRGRRRKANGRRMKGREMDGGEKGGRRERERGRISWSYKKYENHKSANSFINHYKNCNNCNKTTTTTTTTRTTRTTTTNMLSIEKLQQNIENPQERQQLQ